MSETVRCWLVYREYTDKGLVELVYASTDGERVYEREIAANALAGNPATAARDCDPGELRPVSEPETVSRYAAEATRMAERHDPDAEV